MKDFCFCIDSACFDLCFWISTFVVPISTFFIIRLLRPRLIINKSQININELKIEVVNRSKFFDVNNIRIEICVFNKAEGFTYHFEPEHADFLILPSRGIFRLQDNAKTFIARKASESAMIILRQANPNITYEEGFNELIEMLNDSYIIRVRCHGYNSFSGLGRSFEAIF
jgi:hypothetical protein